MPLLPVSTFSLSVDEAHIVQLIRDTPTHKGAVLTCPELHAEAITQGEYRAGYGPRAPASTLKQLREAVEAFFTEGVPERPVSGA